MWNFTFYIGFYKPIIYGALTDNRQWSINYCLSKVHHANPIGYINICNVSMYYSKTVLN